jgi:hypothetical protein
MLRFLYILASSVLASALGVHYVWNVPWWPISFLVGGLLGALTTAIMSTSDVAEQLAHLDEILDD